jgi:mono/diheme cytochrome c family protein
VQRIAGLIGLAGAVLLLAACGGGDGPGVSQGTDLGNGQTQFITYCAGCHTLDAAGTQGTIGPNLDDAFSASREDGLAESTFEQVVRSQIAYPGLDSLMQPDLVTGKNADDVAYFVAQCAGNPDDAQCVPPPPPAAPPAEPAPAEPAPAEPAPAEPAPADNSEALAIFIENCAACHTLAAASAAGAVGPNLDDSQPPLELVIDRVTNGQGGMPPFGDILTAEQIQAVAEFVSSSAGS